MSPPARSDVDTRTRLLEAAMSEFIERGYASTDTNRIARRAGFAPQTFYRWFADKKAILGDVLRVWADAESASWIAVITDANLPEELMAQSCVETAQAFVTFRQHLGAVLLDHVELRQLRAQGRVRTLQTLLGDAATPERMGQLASLLIQAESLCDAIARGELVDLHALGVSEAAGLRDLARLIVAMRAVCSRTP